MVQEFYEKLRSKITEALEYAKTKCDYADLLYEASHRAILTRELPEKIDMTPYTYSVGVHMRLVNNNGQNIELSVTNPDNLKGAIDKAAALLKLQPEGEFRLAPIEPTEGHYSTNAKVDLRTVNMTKVMARVAEQLEQIARAKEKEHLGTEIKTDVVVASAIDQKIIADTDGMFKTQELPRSSLYCYYKTKRNGAITNNMESTSVTEDISHYVDENGTLNAATKAMFETACEASVQLHNARTMTGNDTRELDHVIVHSSVIGTFMHEAIGHPFEADIVRDGSSAFWSKDGKPKQDVIAPPFVNVVDGNVQGKHGSEYIDDEGNEPQKKYLIKNGKLNGMIHSRETAARYGKKPNGGAFSQLGSSRIPRMNCTYLEPADGSMTKESLHELLKDVKKGVILYRMTGGTVAKENMNVTAAYGHYVENGKVTGYLKPATISMDTKKALFDIDAFAGKISVDGIGHCGKEGQRKPVSDGGPEFTRFKKTEHINLTVQA